MSVRQPMRGISRCPPRQQRVGRSGRTRPGGSVSGGTMTAEAPGASTTSRPLPTQRREDEVAVAQAEAPASGFATGDPALLGLPVFVAGSVALATALIGYVPSSALGGTLPII